MADLKNPKLIYLKGILFLLCGLLGAFGAWMESPTFRMAVLLVITVWCLCRFYYFAFYVIEHYVDPGYRFAGLWDFMAYWMRKRRD